MNEEIPPNKLSLSNKRLVGGGFGLMLAWAIINFAPKSVASIASSETGKVILFWSQIVLFFCSIIALVVVCSLLIPTKNFKISKIKFGSAELTFKKDEAEIDGED